MINHFAFFLMLSLRSIKRLVKITVLDPNIATNKEGGGQLSGLPGSVLILALKVSGPGNPSLVTGHMDPPGGEATWARVQIPGFSLSQQERKG